MRALFCAAALAVVTVPATAAAQRGAVTGRVAIATDSAAVPGAIVRLAGTRFGAMADSAGEFRITGVPAGLYRIEARGLATTLGAARVAVTADGVARVTLLVAEAAAELAGVTVLGEESDALRRVPGSAAVITAAQINAQRPLSASEVLRTVPGVFIQEEEGVGLRTNIGIRGLDPDRSRGVLVLEDGVPVALAPYGEPEMYYSPPIDRMERVEIIKGSGSILHGPQTIGGVVNYVTADPAPGTAARVHIQGGSGDSRLVKLDASGTRGAVRGSVGGFQKQADDFNGLDFDVRDLTGKVGVRTGLGDFGLKFSAYDETSNSTYVGLTDSLFRASPRLHPMPGDRLDIARVAGAASHAIDLGASVELRTTAYASRTSRDWARRDYSYNSTGSSLVLRNTLGGRNRSFDVAGIEPRIHARWSLGSIPSDLDVGVRAHYEEARDQFLTGSLDSDVTGIRDDEIRTGRALAAYVQNRTFLTPTLHVTPGVRVEYLDNDRRILRTRVRRTSGGTTTNLPEAVDVRSSDVVAEVIPGIGAAWSPNAATTVFAGAHRGFAPPRTKDALIFTNPTLAPDQQVPDLVSLQLEPERSWNAEFGTRLSPFAALSFEATAFYLDFSNQIIEPSLSAGSVAQAALANQGATRHRGVELAAGLDVARLFAQPYAVRVDLSYTFVDARFSRDRFVEGLTGDTINVRGNALPYAPRQHVHGALTIDLPTGLLVRIDASAVGRQFVDNFETVDASANGRLGAIPGYTVLDATAQYQLPFVSGLTLVGSLKNMTDRVYIASRRPEGIKVGLPRVASLAFTWSY